MIRVAVHDGGPSARWTRRRYSYLSVGHSESSVCNAISTIGYTLAGALHNLFLGVDEEKATLYMDENDGSLHVTCDIDEGALPELATRINMCFEMAFIGVAQVATVANAKTRSSHGGGLPQVSGQGQVLLEGFGQFYGACFDPPRPIRDLKEPIIP